MNDCGADSEEASLKGLSGYRKQNLQVILRRSEITKSGVNFKTEDSPLREI